MATLDELQAQLAALTQRVNEITAPPDDYYTHRFSGEEIDNAVDRVEATPGSGAITAGDIGAAPGGYGLGGDIIAISDANEAKRPGWYAISSSTLNIPEVSSAFNYSFIRVDCGNRPDVFIRQTIVSPYQIWRNCEVTRVLHLGTWYPWEWANPPMQLGVEYRSTERYNGKPVYAKAVNFGAMPNNSQVSVAHGIQNIQSCIYVGGTIGTYNLLGFIGVISVFCGVANIAIKTSEDLSSYSAVVILKYTKSTD